MQRQERKRREICERENKKWQSSYPTPPDTAIIVAVKAILKGGDRESECDMFECGVTWNTAHKTVVDTTELTPIAMSKQMMARLRGKEERYTIFEVGRE